MTFSPLFQRGGKSLFLNRNVVSLFVGTNWFPEGDFQSQETAISEKESLALPCTETPAHKSVLLLYAYAVGCTSIAVTFGSWRRQQKAFFLALKAVTPDKQEWRK